MNTVYSPNFGLMTTYYHQLPPHEHNLNIPHQGSVSPQEEWWSSSTNPVIHGGNGFHHPYPAVSAEAESSNRGYPYNFYDNPSSHTGEHFLSPKSNYTANINRPRTIKNEGISLPSNRQAMRVSTFVDSSFPGDRNRRRRDALENLLGQAWLIANDREPEARILLQFMNSVGTETEPRFQCAFWQSGAPCVKEFSRVDRVLDHLRSHIGLKPFTCSHDGCDRRFSSKAARDTHEKNQGSVPCIRCGLEVIPKNMARHKRSQHCGERANGQVHNYK